MLSVPAGAKWGGFFFFRLILVLAAVLAVISFSLGQTEGRFNAATNSILDKAHETGGGGVGAAEVAANALHGRSALAAVPAQPARKQSRRMGGPKSGGAGAGKGAGKGARARRAAREGNDSRRAAP
ncbi:hypothetical protein FOA52_014525 [Chlamydomonas sp. UWO 241]|nr:hypothetical protein FOA52_014525 [Chlamydomonas sp. UWO 241]